MGIRVTCKSCGKPFEVVGDGRGTQTSRPASCFYCHAVNDITWPAMGTYLVRAVPEYIEPQPDIRAILEDHERRRAASS